MTEALGNATDQDVDAGESIWRSHTTRDRTLLLIGAVVSYGIFHFVGTALGIPQVPHYQASLLANPSAVLAVIVIALTLVACELICSLIAGVVHFEAGL